MTFNQWWRSKYGETRHVSEVDYLLMKDAYEAGRREENEVIAREAKELGGAITAGAILTSYAEPQFTFVNSGTVPAGEMHVVQDGKVIGKITGLGSENWRIDETAVHF